MHTSIQYDKVCVTDMLIAIVFGSLKWKGNFVFITVISHCMTQCCHYLWQNFTVAVFFTVCDSTWGTTICVLNVYHVTSTGDMVRTCFTFPTFLFHFYCTICWILIFGHPNEPFLPLLIQNRKFRYSAKIIPPLKLQLNCMIQIKETGNLNEKNISTFKLYNCLQLPIYNGSVWFQFATEYFHIQ